MHLGELPPKILEPQCRIEHERSSTNVRIPTGGYLSRIRAINLLPITCLPFFHPITSSLSSTRFYEAGINTKSTYGTSTYLMTCKEVHLDTELCRGVSRDTGVMHPCPCSLGLSSSVSLSSLPECHHATHHDRTLHSPASHPPFLYTDKKNLSIDTHAGVI